MVAQSHSRGHRIEWNGHHWVHKDDGSPMLPERPCKRCGKVPGDGGIDPCIKIIVEALNSLGCDTIASCCGHGRQPGNIVLSDGRELVICSFDMAREFEKMFPPIND